MGVGLVEESSAAKEVFEQISEGLNLDVLALVRDSDEDTLRQTQNAQIALYASGMAAYASQGAESFQAYAGHSVGEYAALAAAGIISLSDGAKLVKKRGELMASAGLTSPGTMAAVLGLEREALEAICAQAEGIVVIANDNCPGQLVISGEIAAVKHAGELAIAAGAKRVLALNVSGAFHSPLMNEPAKQMRIALDGVQFRSAGKVYSNVSAKDQPDPALWPKILELQLKNPVRWNESVVNMIADGATEFVEFGGGEVLCGLIKRIDKSASFRSVQ